MELEMEMERGAGYDTYLFDALLFLFSDSQTLRLRSPRPRCSDAQQEISDGQGGDDAHC
jgi:hypothetical protein